MAFARTKIQPPQPRAGSVLARPALEARLGEALLTQRLVLVCAPAGFGKTTALVRQWEHLPAGTALAWVGCDVGDTPARLFECLVAALEPYDPPWRSAPEALVRAAAEAVTPAQRRAIAAELINALDACEVAHGVIVVDDLHRVDHPELHEFLDALLDRFTPRWTLAIATREPPPLALARLRALGEMTDIGPEQLRFDAAETAALLAGAGLADDEAARLHTRTQGWPVGLRLALNAPRGAAARSGAIDQHVFDFLASEVIDRLDPALRDFLLASSVLPELTPGRCAAVTGDALAARRLGDIERAGLFVTTLAAPEPTWRLHDLFREALQTRFAREQPERHAQALQRAAATEPDAQRRVQWLMQAGDWDGAEAALAACADDLIADGAAAAVRALFDRFPAAQRAGSAQLQMLLARARWDWDTAITATARAAEAFAASGDQAQRRVALSYHCMALAGANHHAAAQALGAELLADPALDGGALLRTLTGLAWVSAARSDQRSVAPLLQRIAEGLEPSDSLTRWNECAPLPPYVGLPGVRAPLQRYLDGARRRLPEHPTPLRGLCQVVQGWLHLWVGDVAAAEACAAAAADDNRWLARPVNVDGPSRMLNALLVALRGDGSAAIAALDAVSNEMEASGVAVRTEVYRGLYLMLTMRIAAMVGDAAALWRVCTRLVAERDDGRGWVAAPQRAGAAAHLAWLDGDIAGACQRWQAMLDDAWRSDLYGQLADTRLRLAAALHRQGRPAAEAAVVLAPLFERIADDGEWGVVLLSGPALLAQLAAVDWRGALPATQQALLARWAAASQALARPADAAPAGGGAPFALLTSRELEVLERLAAGEANKHIARAIDISPHTVKRHVANILDKLDLASRGQAAAWYLARRP